MSKRVYSSAASFLLLLAVLFAGSLTPAYSQEVSAGITGTISDASGAVIPGAKVTARELNRGTVYTSTTNAEGIYAFPRIPAGSYELRVESDGLRTVRQSGIILESNQRARLDAAMALGAAF
mgnify:CR=1 FL=1